MRGGRYFSWNWAREAPRWVATGYSSAQPLLVAGERVEGIECPKILEQGAPNYWDLAWNKVAKPYLGSHLPNIGMAINAKWTIFKNVTREYDQLHIHVSRIDQSVQEFLHEQDGHLKTPPAWDILRIKDPKDPHHDHGYRVLKVTSDGDLSQHNLFKLVRDVPGVGAANMEFQTLIVAKRQAGGFYILNSDTSSKSLNPGIGDGERLVDKK